MKRMNVAVVVLALVMGLGSMASAQLPVGWSQTDIGGPSPAGNASYDQVTGTWTVTSDGADIWDTWDSFHFVFRSLKGDGMVTARVVSIAGASLHEWAKAGVMIRETLNANSRHAMMTMTPSGIQNHAAQFLWRPTTGGFSDQSSGGSMNLPYWVRIQRTGNTFRGYISPNGNTWTQQGTAQTISMSQNVYIGLAAVSRVAGQLNTDKFDNVAIQGELIEEVPAKAITYQGRLLDGDIAADGLYDLQFKLFDADAGGSQKGRTVAEEDVDVIDGYFAAALDFGEGMFDGNPRWLEIGVRPGATTGSYTILDPRQRIAPTPYALYAFSGAGGGGGDNLGNHTATQNINLNGHYLSGDGGNKGIYVASDGRVGIGTESPSYELDVQGDIRAQHGTVFANGLADSVNPAYFVAPTYTTSVKVIGDIITTGGKVGIGTSSPPAYDLEVAGTLAATGTQGGSNAQILGTTDSTGYGVAGYSSYGTGVYGSGGTTGVAGRSSSGKGVYGDSVSGYAGYFDGKGYFSGNLGIGTTTPLYKLDVAGLANLNSGIASGGALLVNGAQAIWYDGTTFSWGYNAQRNYFARPVSIGQTDPGAFVLYVNGYAYSTGGWMASDARFKKDVRQIDSALDKVIDLHGVSFEWDAASNPDKQFPQGRHYGVIAQEVEQVVPEVVMEGAQGEKAVSYTELVPILIEAVKELNTQNHDLQTDNAELRDRVSDLTARLERMEAMMRQRSNKSLEGAER